MLTARPTSRRGFSLLELTLVIAIIGVISAVAVPRYAASLNRYRVDAAARRVLADLQLARATARADSQAHWLSFIAAGDSYSSSFKLNSKNAAIYSVSLAASPYQVDLVSAAFTNGAVLRFDGFGMPDGSGSVVLKLGAYSRSVVVDAASGDMSIQ